MILSDRSIMYYGESLLMPFNEYQVQPGSYDLTLGNTFLIPKELTSQPNLSDDASCDNCLKNEFEFTDTPVFDLLRDRPEYELIQSDDFVILPYQFVLATTLETVDIPNDMVGFLHGRSSIGRSGIFVQNAGLIDPGFYGEITLELFNVNPNPVKIASGQRIAQITFETMDSISKTPYNGKYQGQKDATGARAYLDGR